MDLTSYSLRALLFVRRETFTANITRGSANCTDISWEHVLKLLLLDFKRYYQKSPALLQNPVTVSYMYNETFQLNPKRCLVEKDSKISCGRKKNSFDSIMRNVVPLFQIVLMVIFTFKFCSGRMIDKIHPGHIFVAIYSTTYRYLKRGNPSTFGQDSSLIVERALYCMYWVIISILIFLAYYLNLYLSESTCMFCNVSAMILCLIWIIIFLYYFWNNITNNNTTEGIGKSINNSSEEKEEELVDCTEEITGEAIIDNHSGTIKFSGICRRKVSLNPVNHTVVTSKKDTPSSPNTNGGKPENLDKGNTWIKPCLAVLLLIAFYLFWVATFVYCTFSTTQHIFYTYAIPIVYVSITLVSCRTAYIEEEPENRMEITVISSFVAPPLYSVVSMIVRVSLGYAQVFSQMPSQGYVVCVIILIAWCAVCTYANLVTIIRKEISGIQKGTIIPSTCNKILQTFHRKEIGQLIIYLCLFGFAQCLLFFIVISFNVQNLGSSPVTVMLALLATIPNFIQNYLLPSGAVSNEQTKTLSQRNNGYAPLSQVDDENLELQSLDTTDATSPV
ncbi:G-protein coupled receptor [Acrasis kona]|uniref:G-protein coupled receptor n=1 Tax=Acrasis kona TaxID=1008807 RepID=A0AAW2ZFA1_9EUKA